MTKQEQFNKVVAHARKQGEVAVNSYGECQYRAEDGAKCFVGCLIPDDIYEPDMEGLSARDVIIRHDLDLDVSLCNLLQIVHDQFKVSKWEEMFSTIATKYDLTVPEDKS
jgi:hypothetical protein